MVFLSLGFIVAFALLLVMLHIVKEANKQQILLLGFSYIFYAWIDGRFLILLILETLLIYLACLLMDKYPERKKVVMAFSVSVVVLILGIFKYLDFFIQSLCNLFGIESAYALSLLIPMGISFFSFQAISILMDAYREEMLGEKSFLKVALGIGIFTQITSGPIVTAKKIFPQLQQTLVVNKENLSIGLQMILSGIVKKKIIADRLAVAVEEVYSKPEVYSGATLLFTACMFMVQLYMDFAGYSDMAIGLAKMMGLEIGPNFDMPFMAKNTAEFWRRWHISLSTWFKEYVYFPLGGSRKGLLRNCINLFVVMFLSGLWHGASWNFVLWGMLFGITNVTQKLFDVVKKKYNISFQGTGKRISDIASVLICFMTTSIFFVFFRADTLELSYTYLVRVFALADGVAYFYTYGIIFGFLVCGVEIWMYRKNAGHYYFRPLDLSKFAGKLTVCIILWLIICFAYVGGNAFLYEQF